MTSTFVLAIPLEVWAQGDAPLLRLHTGAFDPLVETPQASIDTRAASGGEAATVRAGEAVYIVQFQSTPMAADQEALAALGAKVLAALQDHALIARMSPLASAQAARLARVRWAGPFLADYRLEEALLKRLNRAQTTGQQRYTILLFEKHQEGKDRVAQEIRGLGGTVHLVSGGRVIDATMGDGVLRAVAGMNEVLFVERWTPPENDMDIVRSLSGANLLETLESYTGEGVRGEVMDNGLRTSHGDFQSNPPLIHGGNNAADDHGTPVYGIVFGDGTGNFQGRGMLPDAEQPIFSSYLQPFNRYNHTAELVDPSGPYRAVFQSNSWGNTRTTSYTSISADLDDIIFDHDILITQSQSNEGNQNSRPQAWAKNIVSVGGIVHLNTVTRSDDFWGFNASVGPAADGRIKPDLSAFYDNVFTTDHDADDDYTGTFGGTSAATPEVAGAFGLLFQMWADGVFAGGPGLARDVFDSRPHAATAKALMINSAFQYAFSGTGADLTRVHQGWGFPDLQNLYDTAEANGWGLPILVDETEVIEPGEIHQYQLVSAANEPLKATMVYMDPPGIPNSSVHRVNDLTLKATSPSGVVYWGNNGLLADNWSSTGGSANSIDTVENIFVENPEAGLWSIEVHGDEIVQDGHVETATTIDADYALVVTGGSTSIPPAVSVAASDATATEAGPTSGAFTVSRTGNTGSALTVRYGVGGSATSGGDFAALGASVVIPAGSASAVVPVNPVDDAAVEPDETVVLTVAADAAYDISTPGAATVTIKSDDNPRPSVTIAKQKNPARERGRVKGKARIRRSGATSAPLTVRYKVRGTARPGRDYRALGGTKVIPAGKRSATVSIRPIDDKLVEPDETVVIKLAANPAYTRGAGKRAKITIKSDDRRQTSRARR